ncbi:hypothetical protein K9N50_04090 [bacterium]|nr:hypothetical protein [bacterium]
MLRKLRNSFHDKCLNLMIGFSINRRQSKELSLRNCWDDVLNCLLFWPGDGLDVKAADIVIMRIKKRFQGVKLTVVALPGIGASLPQDVEAKIIEINKGSLNLFGMPVRALKDEILDIRADLAVNLSPEYNPLASYLCLISRAKVSVSFADLRGDSVFNFQIAPNPDREGIDRYRVMANYIG